MKHIIVSAILAAVTLGASLPAHATTVNFFWFSRPTANPDFLVSPDAKFAVTGTLDITVAPGARFSHLGISNVNLFLSGPNIMDIVSTDWTTGCSACDQKWSIRDVRGLFGK
ncbi:MAG: hypothetical protein AAFQ04_10825 [Pseudomonadota bacterium]